MAPRGRPPKPRTSRMDAAIDAMKPYGFSPEVVMAKMRQLLKEYLGEYMFIELDAYSVLLESLLYDQEMRREQNQLDVVPAGEAPNSKVALENNNKKVMKQKSHAIMPTDGFIDIPICSSTTLTVLPPPPPPPPSSPPPPPPPPSPPPIQEAGLPNPPRVLFVGLPPAENVHVQPRRRKPCYGWICDDDGELQFITLPSSLNGRISPPKSPPKTRHQEPQPEWTSGRKNQLKRRSRWDLKPEDM